MKTIILLDRDGATLNYILNQTNLVVTVLVCEKSQRIIKTIAKKPENVLHIVDYDNLLETQSSECIDYKIIEQMKQYQIDIETMLHRIMLNNPLAKDIYHQHLSFFLKIFQTNSIDCILCCEFNLATPNHLIPFGLGKLFNIPTYSLERFPAYPVTTLFNFNHFKRVKFSDTKHCRVSADNLMYYKHCSKQNKETNLLKLCLLKLGGSMLVEFTSCLIKLSMTKQYLGIRYSYFSKLKSLFQLQSVKRFYQRKSKKPDYSDPYVYYSIHMEPEATIIGKTLLESQITIIKMLSRALPKGWKLYVKEHPHQFMLNTQQTDYFLHNITFFKNKSFYEEINKLPNVVLIRLEEHPKHLIKHSQAVATIAGTVTLEALFQYKPTILFSAQTSLFGELANVLSVRDSISLQRAIEKIKNNDFGEINIQESFSYFQTLLIDTSDDTFYPNLFSTITEHAKTIKPTRETI